MKKVLMIYHAFPPVAGSGVIRLLKFVKYLPEYGWSPSVLTMKEEYGYKIDYTMMREVPEKVKVYRTNVIDLVALLHSFKRKKPEGANQINNESADHPQKFNKKNFLTKLKKGIGGLFTDGFIGWLVPGLIKGFLIVRDEKIDVIFSTSPYPTAHIIALCLKVFTGKPWVSDFRDPWEKRSDMIRLAISMENWLQLKVLKYSDRIIANTSYLKNSYIEKYKNIVSDKIVVINNGYDPDDFKNIMPDDKPREMLTISHVGEFYAPVRTPDNFLLAISALIREGKISEDVMRINFVGGGEYVNTQRFKNFLKEINLSKVVNIISHVPHKESIQFMMDSDVLLLFQPSESLRAQVPAKIFEYIRTGNFIFAVSSEGATADIVRESGIGIVVDPNLHEVMKGKIVEIYSNFKNRKLPKNISGKTIAKYDRKELTKDLAQLFDGLVT